MTPNRRGLATLIALIALVALPARSETRWERDASGECTRVWTASELVRGPRAMANGVLLPLRAFAGGFTGGLGDVALAPFSLLAGVAEGGGWLSAGMTDLVTGGWFAVSPDGMVPLQAGPLLLFSDPERSYSEYDNHPGCPGDSLLGAAEASSSLVSGHAGIDTAP